MKKTLSIIMLFLTLSFGLIACGDSNYIEEQEKMIKEQKEEPIFASYSVEEITNMTEDERDDLCLNHHIEVYGIVYDTQAKIQFGDDYEDEFNINCTLNDTDILDEIVIGDFIRLHLKITSFGRGIQNFPMKQVIIKFLTKKEKLIRLKLFSQMEQLM